MRWGLSRVGVVVVGLAALAAIPATLIDCEASDRVQYLGIYVAPAVFALSVAHATTDLFREPSIGSISMGVLTILASLTLCAAIVLVCVGRCIV